MREAEINGYHILVEGFTDIKINDVDGLLLRSRNDTPGCHIQFFDADYVAGFDHLYFAVLNASEAFQTGKNISNELAVEVLLYASGQHQISKAIDLLGVKSSSSRIVVLVVSDKQRKTSEALETIATFLGGKPNDSVIQLTGAKVAKIKEAFGVSEKEVHATLGRTEEEAVVLLLIESAALLVTRS